MPNFVSKKLALTSNILPEKLASCLNILSEKLTSSEASFCKEVKVQFKNLVSPLNDISLKLVFPLKVVSSKESFSISEL